MVQRDDFIEHAAERPDVAALVVGLVLADLWTEVVRRADRRSRAVVGVLKHSRYTEIAHFHLAFGCQEDVLCL